MLFYSNHKFLSNNLWAKFSTIFRSIFFWVVRGRSDYFFLLFIMYVIWWKTVVVTLQFNIFTKKNSPPQFSTNFPTLTNFPLFSILIRENWMFIHGEWLRVCVSAWLMGYGGGRRGTVVRFGSGCATYIYVINIFIINFWFKMTFAPPVFFCFKIIKHKNSIKT